jgi:hypothetical protein
VIWGFAMSKAFEHRIDDPRRLAVYFACCVTERSEDFMHFVGKKGENGLYKTLIRMLPEVQTKTANGAKQLSEIGVKWTFWIKFHSL